MSSVEMWVAVAIMAAVTAFLRLAPFLLFSGRTPPRIITYLGGVLPFAIMGMLVVYCLKDLTFLSLKSVFSPLIAGGIVIGSYIWKRNTLISILAGTVCYMILVQVVFP